MLRRMSQVGSRLVIALALAAVLSGPVVGASAQADGLGTSTGFQVRSGRILGIQPTVSIGHALSARRSRGSNLLTYHGGLVEQTNKVYAIYWVPSGYSVSTNYRSLIDRFFTDVAHDNGLTTNVYYSDTQYSGIHYTSSFAGSVIDTSALPPSGCTDPYTSVCLTDAQIQTEIQNVISSHGWTANSTTEFFMFTARGIGSCFDGSSSICSYSYYCAYHSWIGSGTGATLYANQPYANNGTGTCDVGQHPNNDDADATINVTSHEHNETITDEQASAWFDRNGNENGDKCAWNFGAFKGASGHEYNQTINGHHYWLQQEWSNRSRGCVQTGT